MRFWIGQQVRGLTNASRTPDMQLRLGVATIVLPFCWWAVCSVDTTSGPAESGLGALYAALRMFLLDHPSLPAPSKGQPGVALWIAMFLAPCVTAGAALEAMTLLRRQLVSAESRAAAMEGHIIVCGFGNHGRLVAETAARAGCQVVILERQESSGSDMVRLSSGSGSILVPRIQGDMLDREAMRHAGADRASQIWFCTGSAFANLKAALEARRRGLTTKRCRLVPMVDQVEEESILSEYYGANGGPGCQVDLFSQYVDAARALVELVENRIAIPEKITIIGFGRFGRACLAQVRAKWPHACVEVVDHSQEVGTVCEKELRLPIDNFFHEVATSWAARTQLHAGHVVLLCTDDDAANLRCVLHFRRNMLESSEDGRGFAVLRLSDPPRQSPSDDVTIQVVGMLGLLEPSIRLRLETAPKVQPREPRWARSKLGSNDAVPIVDPTGAMPVHSEL